jgi:hypothetical protein
MSNRKKALLFSAGVVAGVLLGILAFFWQPVTQ